MVMMTLEQEIVATNWQRLNRKQIKAQLERWQQYWHNDTIFDVIMKTNHTIPSKLLKVMDSMNMIYASVYDRECEA